MANRIVAESLSNLTTLSAAERSFILEAEAAGYALEKLDSALGDRWIIRGFHCLAGVITPNDWNHNEMNDAQEQGISESVRAYDFVSEPLVRLNLDLASQYDFELIDGQHRLESVFPDRRVPVNVLFGFTEAELVKLTMVMDETTGTANYTKLMKAIKRVKVGFTGSEGEVDSVGFALPFSIAQAAAQAATQQASVLPPDEAKKSALDELKADLTEDPKIPVKGDGDDERTVWVTESVIISEPALKVVEAAIASIALEVDGLHKDRRIALGQVLELLAADYLGD